MRMVESPSTYVSPVAAPRWSTAVTFSITTGAGQGAEAAIAESRPQFSWAPSPDTSHLWVLWASSHHRQHGVCDTERAPAGCQPGPHQHAPQYGLWGPLQRAWKGHSPGGKIPAKAGHTLSQRQWTSELGITRKGQLGGMPVVSTLASQNLYKE